MTRSPFSALRTTLATLAGTIALFANAPAQAALVTFDYTGQASNGATVQGRFGWETTAPSSPTVYGLGNVVLAQSYAGGGFLTGEVTGGSLDGRSIVANGLTWNVMDLDPACDLCSEDALHIIFSGMFVMLFDYTKTALNGLALPTDLDLSDWAGERRVRLIDDQQGAPAVEDFEILSLKLSATATGQRLPEPGSLALLLVAGAGALAVRRRAVR